MAEEQEKNIIRLLAKGDEEAMGILFRSYHRLLFGAVNKAALKTMREAGKRYFEDFKNSISCFLLSFLTIRLVGAATIHATYCR